MNKQTLFSRLKKALGLTAATGWVLTNFNGCVYGPPAEETTQSVYDSQTESEIQFDPSKNNAQEVYGPPPNTVEETDNSTISENGETDEYKNAPDKDFEPQINENAPVYGPPPAMTE